MFKSKEIKKLEEQVRELEEHVLYAYNRLNELGVLVDDDNLSQKIESYRKHLGRELIKMNCYEIL